MNRRTGFAILMILAAGGRVRADVAPPAGTKLVPVTGVVEAAEEFPEYRFFLANSMTYFGPPRHGVEAKDQAQQWRSDTVVRETFLRPGSPAEATGGRRDGTTLYAVPRSEVGRFPDFDALVRAVEQGQVPGASRQVLGLAATVPEPDPRDRVVVRYRAERSGDRIAFTPLEEPGTSAVGGPASRMRGTGIPRVVAGVAAAFAAVALGVWCVGRKRARKVV